jgi:hypothetical protein
MTMSYLTHAVPGAHLAAGALTQIFVPRRKYPTGYTVQVSGAKVLSSPSAPWVELAASPGARLVRVKIIPRTGSHTELPSQAVTFPLPYGSAAAPPTATTLFALGLPSSAACRRSRTLAFTLRLPRGAHLRLVRVIVDGRTELVRRGPTRRLTVKLSGRDRGSVRVSLVVVTTRGSTLTEARTYRLCAPENANAGTRR